MQNPEAEKNVIFYVTCMYPIINTQWAVFTLFLIVLY